MFVFLVPGSCPDELAQRGRGRCSGPWPAEGQGSTPSPAPPGSEPQFLDLPTAQVLVMKEKWGREVKTEPMEATATAKATLVIGLLMVVMKVVMVAVVRMLEGKGVRRLWPTVVAPGIEILGPGVGTVANSPEICLSPQISS